MQKTVSFLAAGVISAVGFSHVYAQSVATPAPAHAPTPTLTIPASPAPSPATPASAPQPTAPPAPVPPAPEKTTLQDGTAIEINADGTVLIVNPDGAKVSAPDGILTLRDGTELLMKDGKRTSDE